MHRCVVGTSHAARATDLTAFSALVARASAKELDDVLASFISSIKLYHPFLACGRRWST